MRPTVHGGAGTVILSLQQGQILSRLARVLSTFKTSRDGPEKRFRFDLHADPAYTYRLGFLRDQK